MNDFTKEELQALKLCIEDENIEGWTASHYEDLCRKIESMIDNYCDHETRVATSDEDGHMLLMCGHCDVILWHEKN